MAKLRVTYNAAVQSRDEARNQLEKELSEQQLTKWELEHQDRRSKDYETQADKIEMEIAALKSHIPMISECFFLICWLCYQSIKHIIIVTQPTTLDVSIFSGNRGGLQTLFTRMDTHEFNVLLLRFLWRYVTQIMAGSQKLLQEARKRLGSGKQQTNTCTYYHCLQNHVWKCVL